MRRGDVGNKKLGAVGIRACIRHAQDAGTIVLEAQRARFIVEAVAGAAASCAGWVTTLNHKRLILDNAVERYTIVETITRQKHEIVHGDGRFLRIHLDVTLALAGVETRGVVLLWVDLHRGGTP